MHSLAHYALLGSLVAGAAGALVLAAVTVRHGLKRRDPADAERSPEAAARQQRLVRLADTVAVLCFAVSAGLGVMGLMQHTRAVTPAVAATDDGLLAERMQALEKRLASAEIELQAPRGSTAPEWRAWDDRISRLETRVGAVEERAALAERRIQARPRTIAPAASSTRPARPASAPKPAPSASPRTAPQEAIVIPEVAVAPAPPPSAPVAAVTPPVAAVTPPVPPAPPVAVATREPTRAKADAPPEDLSLGEKLRRDWDAVKRHARRGGEEWRDGWGQVKRLFGH